MALGASGALAAPPTVKPPYRHQGECELEPERMAGSLAVLEVGQQARGRKLFLRVGLGGCGTLVAPVQGSLGKRPAAQGDPEQGGGGGWEDRQKGSLASRSSSPAPHFTLSVPCCSSSILWIFLGSEACIF